MIEAVGWFVVGFGAGGIVTLEMFRSLNRRMKRSAGQLLELYRDIAIDSMPDSDLRWEFVRERAAGINVFSNMEAARKYREARDKQKEKSGP